MATHNRLRVLFVDDEKSLQELMRSELPRLGHEVTICADGRMALKVLEKDTFDAAILDLRMPGLTGIELLQRLKQISPDTEAVMMTGFPSQETAIEALRLGAFDYFTKPCKLAEIEAILHRIAEKRALILKNQALETRVEAAEGPSLLVGNSPAMQAVHRLIATIAPTDSTVLILGETGTGKELVARSIFQQSKRAKMPFVPVNCAALIEHLAESELFGHEKGAFTSADKAHKGMFEVANGGSLFLDELGELTMNIQVKLLRLLESGEIRPVGAERVSHTDVRVICATNRDLPKMIATDKFREDLYYRINTFEIRLPSLRERIADLPVLAGYLLAQALKKPYEQVTGLISPSALDAMCHYHWKGNVRELKNAMEYASIIAGGATIMPEHLPQTVLARPSNPVSASVPAAPNRGPTPAARMPGQTLYDLERDHILVALERNRGNKTATAQELGISLKTLYNKLHQYEQEQNAAAG